MDNLAAFIIGALQITLLDLTLCGDNIGVIALATRNLADKFAKKASFFGIMGAILLRIIFACAITLILNIQWIPIKLLGGLLLVKITWDFIKPQEEALHRGEVDSASRFWDAVKVIIIADISMSLDNVLAIAGAANGNVLLIIFGILLNVPIIFFGSQFVANLMKKHPIVIYVGGAILAHTSFNMILEDNLTKRFLVLPQSFNVIFPLIMAILVLLYGFIYLKFMQKTQKIKSKRKHIS